VPITKIFPVDDEFVVDDHQMLQEIKHGEASRKTGFWGNKGAGCIPFAVDTKKFCLAFRSGKVQEPYTWSTWGGAIDDNEQPLKAALRELKEEAGYHGRVLETKLAYVFKHDSGFKYFNYVVSIPTQFVPKMNWETDNYRWVDYDKWPVPLHSGFKKLVNDFKASSLLQEISQ
jgi:8-oxo-dGTP pyrophosphatase MutT (NUDIX family)